MFKFPYTNFNEVNLNWILRRLKEIPDLSTFINQVRDLVRQAEDHADDSAQSAEDAAQSAEDAASSAEDAAASAQDAETSAETVMDAISPNLAHAKCLLIGNSYMRGTGGVIGFGWGYYFQNITGCLATIIQQDGGDFVATGNTNADYPGKTYGQVLSTIIPTMSAAERASYTHIIVGGGYNDRNQTNLDIRNAVHGFIYTAKAMFPNAQIWIIPLCCPTDWRSAQANMFNAWSEGAIAEGFATCVYCWDWMYGHTEWANGDDIHCNDEGYKVLGKHIAAVVSGWDGKPAYNHQNAFTPQTENWTGSIVATAFKDGKYGAIRFTGKALGSALVNSYRLGMLDYTLHPGYVAYILGFVYASDFTKRTAAILEINSGGTVQIRAILGTLEANTEYTLYVSSVYPISLYT